MDTRARSLVSDDRSTNTKRAVAMRMCVRGYDVVRNCCDLQRISQNRPAVGSEASREDSHEKEAWSTVYI